MKHSGKRAFLIVTGQEEMRETSFSKPHDKVLNLRLEF
jgi:hypothetical protein